MSYAVSISTTAIVGTNDGNVQYGFGLGQGTANIATWVNVTGGNAVLPNRPILDVATDPVNPLIGYAAVGGFDENTPAHAGPRLPGDLHSQLRLVHLGQQERQPARTSPSTRSSPTRASRSRCSPARDWGVYYTNDITAASPGLVPLQQRACPTSWSGTCTIDRGFTTLAAFTRSRGAFVWPLPAAPFGGTPTPTVTGTPPTATRHTHGAAPPIQPSHSPPRRSPHAHDHADPDQTPTPLGCGASQPLFENFESGTLGVFTATTTIGTYRWATISDTVNSGVYAAHAFDPDEQDDEQLTQSNPVAIPGQRHPGRSAFAHRYSFEGARLRRRRAGVSTNGGTALAGCRLADHPGRLHRRDHRHRRQSP